MILLSSTALTYSYLRQQAYFERGYAGKDIEEEPESNGNDAVKWKGRYQMDYLEINMQSWRARSLTEDLINQINGIYHSDSRNDGSLDNLRSFYASAQRAIEEGFKKSEEDFSGHRGLLNEAYQQAVKELKDWYHNGGEPRERVNLTTLEIKSTSIELEISSRVQVTAAKHVE